MTYNETLSILREQIVRKKQLERLTVSLNSQKDELTAKIKMLENEKLSEQADADKLEGRSLAAFFYDLVGRREQKLEQERNEAKEAAVKYDAAVKELASVEEDLAKYNSELKSLRGCEIRYARVMEEKAETLKNSGTVQAKHIGESKQEVLRIKELLAKSMKQLDLMLRAAEKDESKTQADLDTIVMEAEL